MGSEIAKKTNEMKDATYLSSQLEMEVQTLKNLIDKKSEREIVIDNQKFEIM